MAGLAEGLVGHPGCGVLEVAKCRFEVFGLVGRDIECPGGGEDRRDVTVVELVFAPGEPAGLLVC
ncbi:MAG: hypothetical protein ACYCO3_16930 [Mycobacteriales bacterium]